MVFWGMREKYSEFIHENCVSGLKLKFCGSAKIKQNKHIAKKFFLQRDPELFYI